MATVFKGLTTGLLLLLGTLVFPAYADYEKGITAFEKGYYQKSHDEWVLLAEDESAFMYVMIIAGKYGEVSSEQPEKAIFWNTKAAKMGDVYAMKKLVYMYSNGEDVPKDYMKAYAFANLAAPLSISYGDELREIIRKFEKLMAPEAIDKAQALSRRYYDKIYPPAAD